jgi:hypothetical protein
MVNGAEYKSFDGTNLIDVVGYIPLVAVATPPTGGGTDYEGINLLIGKKRQQFSANGSATVYYAREQALTSVDSVYVNGALKTLTTDYSVNLTNGTVTFVVAPTTGQNNVEIYWTKGTGSRSEITGYKQVMLYGGKNDTRVFLYGNNTNKMHFSNLANGVPSAEYFSVLDFSTVGSTEFPITGLAKQYDRQIIFTTGGTYYSIYEIDANGVTSLPIYPLNDAIGNIALGQVQVVKNNPVSIYNGVRMWTATNVRDERNESLISTRVQALLDKLNLTTAVTYDYEELREYWLCIGKTVFVYNYGNDTWYLFELAHTPTSFIVISGVLFMGTSEGKIMEWANYLIDDIPVYLTDDGTTINSYFETGFMDFGLSWKRKFLNFAWVGMKPEQESVCFVEWESDYDVSTEPEYIYYSLINFADVDFADFTFETNYNPQPFRLKLKAKKFTYLKLKLSNDSATDTMTILNLNLPATIGGVAK